MPRRPPEFLTSYLCYFCETRIRWGEIVRILRRDPDQPAFEHRENYAHLGCLRGAMADQVPLAFLGERLGAARCGVCSSELADGTILTLQRPKGTVRRPAFDDETVAVHTECLDKMAGWRRAPRANSDRSM